MLVEALLGAGALLGGGIAVARGRRVAIYRELERQLDAVTGTVRPPPPAPLRGPLPDFRERLAVLPSPLLDEDVADLRAEAEKLASPERSYIPLHKAGGTVAYETLIAAAPHIVALYHSAALRDLVSRIIGQPVRPTPLHDQSSLSVLFYMKPGDHIGWHYDHNFYRGRHFTLLLPLVNRGSSEGGLSHARLIVDRAGEELAIPTPPNTLIVFEGARVRHKVVPIAEGERRIVLSMTYCTDPRAHWWQGVARRVKDVGFYGIRALWT